jgi:uncharacterized protein (TIGR01777 family)
MRVLLTGGTGFIGVALVPALRAAGHAVTVVSREPEEAAGDAIAWEEVGDAIAEHDAVVNLAGEPIAGRRWRPAQKQRIRESRELATRLLVEAITAAARRPAVMVSASAVGYYGPQGDEPLTETAPAGTGFLAEVCRAWEEEAQPVEGLGVRLVRLRIGIVLGPGGGALARMLPPMRAFVGGRLGSGTQWMSWIHRDDVTSLVVEALGNEAYAGPVNATAPTPVTNAEFTRTLAEVVARPAWLPVPAFALRLALGEMADMLLTGQRVLPSVADGLGYVWRYPELATALRVSVRH